MKARIYFIFLSTSLCLTYQPATHAAAQTSETTGIKSPLVAYTHTTFFDSQKLNQNFLPKLQDPQSFRVMMLAKRIATSQIQLGVPRSLTEKLRDLTYLALLNTLQNKHTAQTDPSSTLKKVITGFNFDAIEHSLIIQAQAILPASHRYTIPPLVSSFRRELEILLDTLTPADHQLLWELSQHKLIKEALVDDILTHFVQAVLNALTPEGRACIENILRNC
jgi:hypothetical protein